MCGFFYGHWPYALDRMASAKKKAEAAGLRIHLINIPLGHPGDSLGSTQGSVPLTPPKHWKMGTKADGNQHSGTSLHPPATAENVKAIETMLALGRADLFLDDDFRLAVSPGMVGGCYCDEHKAAFCKVSGFTDQQWTALKSDALARHLTPDLKTYINFSCDELTASFRAQQTAHKTGRMGNMIMFMGSEKAGIRLTDYKDALFRVGESHFDDNSFGSLKGKCDELFSVLFHRRFTTSELAFSETTAYPHDQLSSKNLAAKLSISTISDTRNSMFMSGLTPFPAQHWSVLKPSMKKNAEIHARIAGHIPEDRSNISRANMAAMSAMTIPLASSSPPAFLSKSAGRPLQTAGPSSVKPTPQRQRAAR